MRVLRLDRSPLITKQTWPEAFIVGFMSMRFLDCYDETKRSMELWIVFILRLQKCVH